MTKTILAIACLLIASTAIHLVHQQGYDGLVVNIKGSNGKYLSSSDGFDFGPTNSDRSAYPVSASVSEKDPAKPWAQWVVEQHGDQYAVKNVKTNTYLARCNNCWNGVKKSTWDDSAFCHVNDVSEGPWALWSVKQLDNGKWIIKGDNNEYLNVCNLCIENARWKDYAFVEVDNPEEESLNGIAQWQITPAPQ